MFGGYPYYGYGGLGGGFGMGMLAGALLGGALGGSGIFSPRSSYGGSNYMATRVGGYLL